MGFILIDILNKSNATNILYNFDFIIIKINILKIIIYIYMIIIIIINKKKIFNYNLEINENYINIQKYINLTFSNSLKKKIKIGIFGYCIRNGGRARITAFLLNYLYKIKIFEIFLFTKIKKENDEYIIPKNIKRTVIKNNLIKIIRKYKIDILIYQLYNIKQIETLNKLKNIKIIFYLHSSIFDWIYENYSNFKLIYKSYSQCKYAISIVHIENDYLFSKWRINSIFMKNFISYEYNFIIPSELSSHTILMIGRGNAKKKRFEIGIQSMEYIIKEVIDCKLKIVSSLIGINHHQDLVNNLNLENNIQFIGYSSSLEIIYKKASINFFPSISESFGLVLSETKVYGLPNILLGLDYLSIAKRGIIMIYDDSPESLAKESINLLINKKIKKFLGNEAKRSMKDFNNESIYIKWIKLILSINNRGHSFQELKYQDSIISKKESLNIINNQINLLKLRNSRFKNITINIFENFSYMEKIN